MNSFSIEKIRIKDWTSRPLFLCFKSTYFPGGANRTVVDVLGIYAVIVILNGCNQILLVSQNIIVS
jgi:hypothetical protein